jgi:hypothetical protein
MSGKWCHFWAWKALASQGVSRYTLGADSLWWVSGEPNSASVLMSTRFWWEGQTVSESTFAGQVVIRAMKNTKVK